MTNAYLIEVTKRGWPGSLIKRVKNNSCMLKNNIHTIGSMIYIFLLIFDSQNPHFSMKFDRLFDTHYDGEAP